MQEPLRSRFMESAAQNFIECLSEKLIEEISNQIFCRLWFSIQNDDRQMSSYKEKLFWLCTASD